jgi:hypothetical protein
MLSSLSSTIRTVFGIPAPAPCQRHALRRPRGTTNVVRLRARRCMGLMFNKIKAKSYGKENESKHLPGCGAVPEDGLSPVAAHGAAEPARAMPKRAPRC